MYTRWRKVRTDHPNRSIVFVNSLQWQFSRLPRFSVSNFPDLFQPNSLSSNRSVSKGYRILFLIPALSHRNRFHSLHSAKHSTALTAGWSFGEGYMFMLKVHYWDSLKRNIQSVNEKSSERQWRHLLERREKRQETWIRGSIWSFKWNYDTII